MHICMYICMFVYMYIFMCIHILRTTVLFLCKPHITQFDISVLCHIGHLCSESCNI